jgi:hypothetical protein
VRTTFLTIAAALTLTLPSCSPTVGVTVTGTVVDFFGGGVAGVSVAIGDSTATTGAGGTFTVPGVSVPYDLVVYQLGPNGYAHLFAGLTSPTPTVMPHAPLDVVAASHPSSQVSGALPIVVPAGDVVQVCIEGLAVAVYGCDRVEEGDDSYLLGALWAAGDSVDVTLHALPMTIGMDGFPTDYPAHGTEAATLSDGGVSVAHVTDFVLVDDTIAVSATIAPPPGYDPEVVFGAVRMTPNFALPVFAVATTDTTVDVEMPDIGDGTVLLLAIVAAPDESFSAAWAVGQGGAAPATLDPPQPPELVAPPHGAAGVTHATEFRIASDPGAVRTFRFVNVADETTYYVTTTDDAVRLPDLSHLGLDLASGASSAWGVSTVPAASTVDDAALAWELDYSRALTGMLFGGPGADGDGAFASSAYRPFVTD